MDIIFNVTLLKNWKKQWTNTSESIETVTGGVL